VLFYKISKNNFAIRISEAASEIIQAICSAIGITSSLYTCSQKTPKVSPNCKFSGWFWAFICDL